MFAPMLICFAAKMLAVCMNTLYMFIHMYVVCVFAVCHYCSIGMYGCCVCEADSYDMR